MFRKSKVNIAEDFAYLPEDAIYFDSACQSLRPQQVIDAMQEYYTKFNSCGERVKYEWGLEVDRRVEEVRDKILKLLKLSKKDYFVSFTLNTTYGLNLVQSQLKPDGIAKVMTSDIEHNSSFLSTMATAKRLGIPREVIVRNDDGSVDVDKYDFTNALVVMNAVSNIDGRQLKNIKEVIDKVHRQGGIYIIDAAQAMSYYHDLIAGLPADAICFSSHKMYGPSMGVMVLRRDLLNRMDIEFIGGGMVDDVTKGEFVLSAHNPEHIHTALEAGLQPYAEAIGLGAAIDWMQAAAKTEHEHVRQYSQQIIGALRDADGMHVLNAEPTPTIAFYSDKINGHLLAEALSDAGVMVRSGYFCVHYYLNHIKHYPPMIRLSLAMNNRQSDVDRFMKIIGEIAK